MAVEYMKRIYPSGHCFDLCPLLRSIHLDPIITSIVYLYLHPDPLPIKH